MDVAFVYVENENLGIEPHPLHVEWADSVDAAHVKIDPPAIGPPLQHTFIPDVWLNSTASVPNGFDVYLLENPGLMYALPKLRYNKPEAEFIFLDTNWRRFGRKAYDFSIHNCKTKRWGDNIEKAVDGVLQRRLLRSCDGVISASRLFAGSIEEMPNGPPVRVCNPHISYDRREELSHIFPDYECNNAVVFGEVRGHKGQDLVVDAWDTVNQQYPNAELHLIGKGTQRFTNESIGVLGHGFVDQPKSYFQTASVAIHPARIDAFPLSTIETMAAGIPTLVSTKTGTKSLLEEVPTIVPFEAKTEIIARHVCRYFDYPTSWRRELGEWSRKSTQPYTGKCHIFRNVLDEIVNEVS